MHLGDEHLAGGRGLHVENHWKRVVVDHHELGRVGAERRGLGDDDGNRLTDESDLAGGQDRTAEGGREHDEAGRHVASREVQEIVVAVDGEHARRRLRFGGVDGKQPRVRHRGPDEHRVDRAGEQLVLHVGGVRTSDGQELRIFLTNDSGTNDAHAHAPDGGNASETTDPSTLPVNPSPTTTSACSTADPIPDRSWGVPCAFAERRLPALPGDADQT